MKRHPEVDFNALMQFYTTLDAQTQGQLAQEKDPLIFFENLLALYKGGRQTQQSQPLPTQLNGVETNSSAGSNEGEMPMNRF